ncbi:sigma-70 family RNA polymerase sigma factor [Microbacterium sp. cx-55]|uniref:RNA polymerase sigma factor n=1 Tax=unclassified Microbacterium TaxID=2609290 RepID=UPI001CBBCD75|nr:MULTISPECIES: sigma-70 family RNA polymerase sigma factor [unclassified Microbacterium]MBZ4486094.1 sigma-70 family RNA polymerase sigma factor [Microbacterium sp. cx-55]MCC4907085.1 sigma-70 family RNA polymerase sigma factor [Microbacterium sp. cx-59]UGB34035.1 sigma-70 family RNA polymerase sigma factor [Microbacterium sp. cx-55]
MATDAELIARAEGGEAEAFRQLYRRHVDAVYRIAVLLLEDRTDAEDAVQDAFVTAWGKLTGFRLEGESALPWLATICRFTCANRLRARRRERAHVVGPADEHLPATVDVEQDVVSAELAERIAREVGLLSDIDREIFVLCVAEGYAYGPAAAALGLSHGAVRNRLSRIRGRLRRTVEEGTPS